MPPDATTAAAVLIDVLLLVLPGLALLAVLRPLAGHPSGGDLFVRLGVAVGAGLALVPLVYLWAAALHLRLGPAFWWAWLALSALVVGLDLVRRRRALPASLRLDAAQWTLLALLGAALAARWWAARELTVPLWGDSFQHSLMVRLFLEQGGLPADWRPYADLSTFTYHFGLHGQVAALAWLTGLPPERSLLVAGQVLMVLQILTLYALAAGLTGRRWAGVGAGLAAAGLGPMPGFYLNWGRYTQLAGQVLLPAAALAASLAPRPRLGRPEPARPGRWRRLAFAAVLVAGLALTHYLVTVFFAAWGAAWVLVGGSDRVAPEASALRRERVLVWARRAAARVAQLVAVAALALAFTLPWVPRFLGGVLDDMAARLATTRVATPETFGIVSPATIWGSPATIDRHLGLLLVGALVLAALYGLARRAPPVALGLVWGGLLLLAAYPGLLGLPVSGVLKDFTVVIGLYLPAGLVLGGALAALVAELRTRHPLAEPATAAVVALLAVALAFGQRDLVDRQFELVTPADEQAMAWIREHTPVTAVFLVSSFDAFGATVQAGDDAGWWIPVLTGRRTTVPPITIGTERAFEPGYRERLNRLATACRTDLDGEACRSGLDTLGVAYAYVGATGKALPRGGLATSPRWRLAYDGGPARVYERRR